MGSPERFLNKLNELFKATGWSQNRLAKESGLAQSLIGAYLAGRVSPSLANIDRLSKALGVSPITFLNDEVPARREVSPREALETLIRALGNSATLKQHEISALSGLLDDALSGDVEDDGDTDDESDQNAK